MKIEKLNDNKIRIIFTVQELKINNIDYHSFMSGSDESKIMFQALLFQAKKEVNFNIENCNIAVETLELSNGNFILTITKIGTSSKKINVKRKIGKLHNNSSIYRFYELDDYIDFKNFLKKNSPNLLNTLEKNSYLINFNKNNLLIIQNINLTENESSFFCSTITEFAEFINNSDILIAKILENKKA